MNIKKKIYHIVDSFETNVDDYSNDISSSLNNLIDLNSKHTIISREFYKMWELIQYFNLYPLNEKKITTLHICDTPVNIQSVIYFRNFYGTNITDTHVYVDSFDENDKKFIEHHKKNVSKLDEKKQSRVDIIIGTKSVDYKLGAVCEQNMYVVLIEEIIFALKYQKKGGTFVCKFYETFTDTSIKLICILNSLYDEVTLVKPFTSRLTNPEKYFVCKQFKTTEKMTEQYSKILSNLLNNINGKKDHHISNIFLDYDLDNSFKNQKRIFFG